MPRIMFLVAFLVAVCAPQLALAASTEYQAGAVRITVPDVDGAFNAIVWYPTSAPEKPWQAGPFTISASQNAPIATDRRFPVVLFSHGRGGSPLSHRELEASLAREGFVVVAPAHLGDTAGQPQAKNQAQILMARPRQAMEALNAALADRRFAEHVDSARIGMIGYSAGGYTALVLAGARPDFEAATAYCQGEGQGDIGSCGPAKDGTADADKQLGTWQPPTEPRLKALVLMDPLSFVFDKASLAAIKIPVLLLRPKDDAYMSAAPNALALAKDLPTPPEQIVVPGRHFVFIDPCPEKLAAEAPLICKDGPSVDRTAIHRTIEHDVADFLRAHL
ncbi:alpha/beta hydrolase family protein [Phyllobacterium leguminum]|uniref:Putative dienelactone hydrolase n=1 Tax=Phyllobacterium leguminum TaxID=314237 RepID=A0A318TBE1_9HYPH|nr:alpha/beta fold hydrolase [Phyllobacterium leguminum]PYE88250.1 putative dienelactone hydrolase [Phyllobacterium leguminum]